MGQGINSMGLPGQPPINGDVTFTGAVIQIDNQTIDFGVANKTIILDSTGNIQTALDELKTAGGGILHLRAGTYVVTSSLTWTSNITISGESAGDTIVYFATPGTNLSAAGTAVYTTGTITAIAGGVNVTGSGTSWLTNAAAGQYIFIGTRWYKIASVTTDTTLVLSEGYGDNVTLPSTYRIASIQTNLKIADLTFTNSTVSAVTFADCRDMRFDNVTFVANSVGVQLTNCSLCLFQTCQSISNTSHGASFTNCGFTNAQYFLTAGNAGHGIIFNNVKTMALLYCAADANTLDGYNCTTVVDTFMNVDLSGNGSQGMEMVLDCSNCFITGFARSNVSDGIKLTSNADSNTIGPMGISNNGGYGINISNANCDMNTIVVPTYASNTSGNLNDSSTSTVKVATFGSDNKMKTGTLSYLRVDDSNGSFLGYDTSAFIVGSGVAKVVVSGSFGAKFDPTGLSADRLFTFPDKAGTFAMTSDAPTVALFDHFADAGSSHTDGTEDDLYSDTISAARLANNGEKLEAEYGGVFVSSATATRKVKIYFGGTAIFDTGALTLSLSAAWTCYLTIIRVSATVIRYMISLTTEGAALAAYTAVGELTGLTLSNTNVLKITGAAAGVGAAANDIVAKMALVEWKAKA